MQRFDEIELDSVPMVEDDAPPSLEKASAPRMRRLAALLTDLSLFVALCFVLVPLLPQDPSWLHYAALSGFVVMLSYYYYVGCWMLGGKTLGGAIFEVRIVPDQTSGMSLRGASVRWAAFCLSIALLGLGLALAALPSRRSLPDRLSATHTE